MTKAESSESFFGSPFLQFHAKSLTGKGIGASLHAYARRPNNTGVLLSGKPGTGKSLFIKLLAQKAKEQGYPILIVKEALNGLVDILGKINCRCVILLDEFEKVFTRSKDISGNPVGSKQDEFLSLLDGMASGQKLFVAAINDKYAISSYMLNRPGRFLYHFEFDYLNSMEIEAFLRKSSISCENQRTLCRALVGHNINYDAINAIVTEIENGESIKDTLHDLNLDREGCKNYNASIMIDDANFTANRIKIDLSYMEQTIHLSNREKGDIGITIDPQKIQCQRDGHTDILIVNANDVSIKYVDFDDDQKTDCIDDLQTNSPLILREHLDYRQGFLAIGN